MQYTGRLLRCAAAIGMSVLIASCATPEKENRASYTPVHQNSPTVGISTPTTSLPLYALGVVDCSELLEYTGGGDRFKAALMRNSLKLSREAHLDVLTSVSNSSHEVSYYL